MQSLKVNLWSSVFDNILVILGGIVTEIFNPFRPL